jgi:hypothetical protein
MLKRRTRGKKLSSVKLDYEDVPPTLKGRPMSEVNAELKAKAKRK